MEFFSDHLASFSSSSSSSLLCFISSAAMIMIMIITLYLIIILLKQYTTTKINIINNNRVGFIIKKWPLVGSLPHILLNLHRLHDWSMEVTTNLQANTHYLGQGLVFTSDPKNVEYILKTNFSNFPKGPDYVETFDFLGQGIFTVDSHAWRVQRKMANTVFAAKEFRSLVAHVSNKVVEEQLVPLLIHVCSSKGKNYSSSSSSSSSTTAVVVDLQDVFKRYAFDTMTCIVVGTNPETLSIGFPYNEFSEATDDALRALFYRHLMPIPLWKLLRWLKLGTERKMIKARRIMDRYIASACISLQREIETDDDDHAGQQQQAASCSSLLAMYMIRCSSSSSSHDHHHHHLLLQGEEEEEEGCNNKFLCDSALNFLLAGRDTVPSALTWFFYLVSKNPRVEAKILEELSRLFALKSNKAFRVVVFDFEDMKEMVYLHAALYESMRIYPPVPLNRKSVQNEDVLPDGNIVRPGMKILFSIYGMGRMESIWGKDCMEFRPERWLDDNGKLNYEAKTKYYVFNMGPRSCVGKDAALAQIKMAAAAILFNFKVKVIQPQNFSPSPAVILQMKNGFMVQIQERVAH